MPKNYQSGKESSPRKNLTLYSQAEYSEFRMDFFPHAVLMSSALIKVKKKKGNLANASGKTAPRKEEGKMASDQKSCFCLDEYKIPGDEEVLFHILLQKND